MRSLIYVSTITILARYANADKENNLESPFGLTFSPTTIFASRLNASGSIEITRYPVSPEYQVYYEDAVYTHGLQGDKTHDAKSVASMFDHIISLVTKSLSSQLGHKPEYSTLFLPSVFDRDTLYAATEAVFPDDSLERPLKIGLTREAACYGYGFFEGKHLGLPLEESNDDGPESLIVVLEYEDAYLYAWFVQVAFDFGTFYVSQQEICKDCGERFRDFLDVFINKALLEKHRDDIRAIVIVGEASAPSISELGMIAKMAVGTEVVNVVTDIDPTEAVAHGAAVWARLTQQFPQNFLSQCTVNFRQHDEL
ncbi:hypothetical protein P153DRAFT_303421 [Dothidotthia symphoricarpi CBS 119687]|uniref:Actin-like ATPase domain-containing protein n=1 Tax=Dothidotthia symphoricarpi CBS 119687 TaxID=1392245 RepID=A0A6A5ZYR0_9PLEO|nr:uncharacterized protein P153DRAFT_303421 [Dothidotthia symphoricarpi CBS 119687]KAF2123917.1 hypothetical protein P153DRAFT_303421 [Dothidotthia symphoricarpi CBS 119687]